MDESLEQYEEATSEIVAAMAAQMFLQLDPYRTLSLGSADWIRLLLTLWPDVAESRTAVSVAARDFYDREREKHIGETRDVWLNNNDPDEFQDVARPYRVKMSRPALNDNEWVNTRAGFTIAVVHHVRDGGRRTLTEALIHDDVAGFARVDPQPPSCGFCSVLISRGPAYTAEEYENGNFVYHPHDTCTLVPVFDENNFPGHDQWQQYEADYKKATKLAKDQGITVFMAMEKVRG